MHFKNPDGVSKDLYLLPRTLMVFSGEVRYNWLHSIAQRKIDKVGETLKFRGRRISLTFRKVKKTPCECRWPGLCDSQNKSSAVTENMLGGEAGSAPVYKENKE